MSEETERDVLARCQRALPGWRGLPVDAFDFSAPRGFSSFTMGVRCRQDVTPDAVLYRHLDEKPNALLGYDAERHVYETLAGQGVAAPVLAYEADHRLEAFYEGTTLSRHDLEDATTLGAIGARLAELHDVAPQVPARPFFELAFERWAPVARDVITTQREVFPEVEHEMCEALLPLVQQDTLRRVRAAMPRGELGFCHNDTYHGNIMRQTTGEIRLLDFEFSCLNHPAFDFANLFAETVMRHGEARYPHFSVAAPTYTDDHIAAAVEGYLRRRKTELRLDSMIRAARQMIPLSDFMYALAATTLAVEPIQKIRFIPYALARFNRFVEATD